jgi:hypothetical protein
VKKVMKDGVHFGVIPGTEKPTLYKPGAEVLGKVFRLAPKYENIRREMPGGHLEITSICRLYAPDGTFVGEGSGSCSTLEKKYRWRSANIKCPVCGKETVFKSKQDGQGWYCWMKKGGCGATWPAGAPEIEKQERGTIENPDIADQYNTVLKMAMKRALVCATIGALAVSDTFTQDMEDHADEATKAEPVKAEPEKAADPNPEPPAEPKPATPSASDGAPRGASDKQVNYITQLCQFKGQDMDEIYERYKVDVIHITSAVASEMIKYLLTLPDVKKAGAR